MRPTKYDSSYPQMLIEHMDKGFSFESFGGVVRVARRTLYLWLDAHEEFREAYDVAISCSLRFWEQHGIDGLYSITTKDADGTVNTSKLNTAVWIFNMINRCGWQQKKEVEDVRRTASDIVQVTFESVDEDKTK